MHTYLERHGIGDLFEDMMAKLIKEMPNEPINYLIDLLQKVNQNRFTHESRNTYPSTILYKSDMALTGSSIELKRTKDPQKILPGSKQPTSLWLESKREEDLSDNDERVSSASRTYEKPWLTGSKQIKDRRDSDRCVTPSWETDLKSRKSIDVVDQKINNDVRKSWVSRSTTTLKESFKKKNRERIWSDEPHVNEKENNAPQGNSKNYSNLLSSTNNMKKKNNSLGDEVQIIESRPQANFKKTICSPQTYSKFKRKLSKKKSFENKEKLQALLATDQTRSSRDNDGDSTDGEGDEVFDNNNELILEGSRAKNVNGSKYLRKSSPDNLSVCSKCSQPTEDSPMKSRVEEALIMSDDDDDNISSVSQLDPTKSYKPVWSPLPPGTGDMTDEISKAATTPPKGILQKSKFDRDNNNNLIADSVEKNLLKNKMKNNNKDNVTENPLTKSWRTKLKDDSESEPEEDLLNVTTKKIPKGWKQNKAFNTDL